MLTHPANVRPLFIFEDSDAVIKMTIKGRSQTMRHVSRTHRVERDWLFDKINLDPGIQINCVHTSKQLADILTKGSFSRERCSQWTHIFNLMTPHMHSCSHFTVLSSSSRSDDNMSKRQAGTFY